MFVFRGASGALEENPQKLHKEKPKEPTDEEKLKEGARTKNRYNTITTCYDNLIKTVATNERWQWANHDHMLKPLKENNKLRRIIKLFLNSILKL